MTSRFTWTAESIKEEALKYSTKIDFKKASHSAVSAARRLGIYEEVTSHMLCGVEIAAAKVVNGLRIKFAKLSSNVKQLMNFRGSGGGAHRIAKEFGIYDEITAHLVGVGPKL